MKRTAAGRLRRLRRLLTLVFTGINAVGLIVFAWLLISDDDQQGERQLDADLQRVTAVVARLLQYDASSGTLVTGFVSRDELNDQCPQFFVLPGASGQFPAYSSAQRCVPVEVPVLGGFAEQAARSGKVEYGQFRGAGDRRLRMRAEPVRSTSGQFIGAVVAVTDAEPAYEDHLRYTLIVFGSCLVLIGALGLAGHFIAGRAIRPAAAALEQQEILLAETAHDLRTPVAALRALAEASLRNPEQSTELLPRTVGLAARMGGIIDSLLVRARLAAGVDELATQPVWLDQLVTGLAEDTPSGGASVTVTAAPSLVHVDPGLVQRAIGNLLDNALRYGRQPGQPAIVHITVAGGRVTVADHGPGVADEVAGGTLDRFTSGSGSTGLGLSIVRWVAEAHGGTLAVYNADEGGAIFELTLPVATNRS
ncbi:sensor histidine kinase [Amycolatopsis jiangsuensis]|uniref:histidine kinase n=1 Tax=Amycolatopsis jiangsuensis TaxID=1181879 RepID=A0A840IZT4_9PSEU|nr:HAMP domain-containing sensor histidine kinase [Amycolatopsis jiangsuensis]MBB4688371.1 signal transduction histidine kinase [Amycolatopsis jiangsuensis]